MNENTGNESRYKKPDSLILLIPWLILFGIGKVLLAIGKWFLGCLKDVLDEFQKLLSAILTKILFFGIIALAIYAGYLMITGRIDREKELAAHPMDIQMEHTSGQYAGRNISEVIEELRENGFTNIHTETLTDLSLGILTKDGAVASVTIDGVEDYSKDTWFSRNSDVCITYHTFFKISEDSITLKRNKTKQLSVVHTDSPAEGWTSSNPEIAEVDDTGLVTARKKGTARITLWIDGEEHCCEVLVK